MNAEVQRTAPSLVAYIKGGDRLVGMIAKRFNGRKMNEVDEESKHISFRVVKDDNGNIKLDCPAIGKQFAAEEIFAQHASLIMFGDTKTSQVESCFGNKHPWGVLCTQEASL